MRQTFLLFIGIILALGACSPFEFPAPPYPTSQTLPVTNISGTGATFGAKIDNLQGEVIDHGFIWGTSGIIYHGYGDQVSLGVPTDSEFSAIISYGLIKDKKMYVRAFVSSTDKVVYSKAVEFNSLGSTPPSVTNFTPAHAPALAEVTINGTNFSYYQPNIVVRFGNTSASILNCTDTKITCLVPEFPGTTATITVTVLGQRAEAAGTFAKD